MVKKLSALFLTLAVLAALAAPARADVLWEPYGNRFYDAHSQECTYLGRGFYANGAEGFVTIYDAPEGALVAGQYENGHQLWVYWVYQDWGCVSVRGESTEGTVGWAPLADLRLIYDGISFSEEYAGDIQPYDGQFAAYAGDAAAVNFYEYPGAAEVKRRLDLADGEGVLSHLTGTADEESYIQAIFADENGLTWAYVGYLYGHVDGWFCIDEPDGENFPLREVPEAGLTPPQTPRLPASAYLPYLLVGAVTLLTAGLLTVRFRRRRR